MILHLAVIDIPYLDANGITTGDVAEIIEAKYGLLGDGFVPAHEADIAQVMAEGVQATIEQMFSGAPATISPYEEGCAKVATMMKRFVTTQEDESVGLPGVPTGAALAGVNKRKKIMRGPRRPSFVDSSLLSASFTSFVSDPIGYLPGQQQEIEAIQSDLAK